MAGMMPLIRTDELKTGRLTARGPKGTARQVYSFHYDNLADAVTILLVQPEQAVIVHYLDDYLGFLYEEDSLEIVGLRIDAFEKVFLPANRTVQRTWLNIQAEKLSDFGQLTILFERTQPQVVREVVKAARPLMGPPGAKLAAFAGA